MSDQSISSHKPTGFLKLLLTLASLRLTVILFLISLFLVFAGTLAQVDNPTWTAVTDYFRSFFVFVPSQVFVRFFQAFRWVPPTTQWGGGFYFPGGWTVGFLLLINLLAAHAVRFKFNWKRSGILMIHSGLIVLMIGELVTGLFAVEGNMTMEQGGATNYLELRETSGFLGKINGPELAFSDLSNPKSEKVVVIPNHMIRNKGKLSDPALPFDIEVLEYMNNSSISENTSQGNLATKGDGMSVVAISKPEVSGTSSDQKIDLPSAYIRLIDKKIWTGKWCLPGFGMAFTLQHETNPGSDNLGRPKVADGPADETLLQTISNGTDRIQTRAISGYQHSQEFSSKVKLVDPVRNDSFETLISMNNPLRYEGETFYQSGFLPGDKGTILQVVRNPGWLLPYLSCALVSIGMLIHFGMHLNQFITKRANNHAS